MKNSDKNRSAASYSASEAAEVLGVSIPTLRRMVERGTLEGFQTPGGHLRIVPESIEALREQRRQPRPVREASPVLHNRRERLEELTLEAQEIRAKREPAKLRRDEQEEAERREAETQAREEEAAQRQAELELEQERLRHQQAQERIRLEREREQECQRVEAEERLAAFRCQWIEKANEALSAYEYRWLSARQRNEILEGLEAEITRRQPADEPRMDAIVARTLESLAEPHRLERDAQERRQRLTDCALRSLPYSATEAERARAAVAIREALQALDSSADECQMRVAAEEAVRPVREAIERRELEERLIRWAIQELPFTKTEADKAELRRGCAEILAELPDDVSEWEAKKELEPAVSEACSEIKKREAEKDRRTRKARLVQRGIAEVMSYLLELYGEGELSNDDYWDSDFRAGLRETVRHELESELSGDESDKEIRELVHEIVDEELD